MKEKELRRTLAVFPIGSVMKLTDLTARQIRYYEDQQLITPDRFLSTIWIACWRLRIICLKALILQE